MSTNRRNTPESSLIQIGFQGFGWLKKIFSLIILLIGYWQAFEYFSEKPELKIFIEECKHENDFYNTLILIKNGSESINEDDFVAPVCITFSGSISKIIPFKSEVKNHFVIEKNTIKIKSELLNKNEEFKFIILSEVRPQIKNVQGRIKGIENIEYYDFELKPKPLNRLLNFWFVLIIVSSFLLIDALLVIGKDKELSMLYNHIKLFPLDKKNKKEYIARYVLLYNNYPLRIKPDSEFMEQIINNLFLCFPSKSKKEIAFIKNMAILKTEWYTLYRLRTAFIVVSPIFLAFSIMALILNYFYYEIYFLKNLLSLNLINKTTLTILLIAGLLILVFPRSTMNYLFVKKGAKKSF